MYVHVWVYTVYTYIQYITVLIDFNQSNVVAAIRMFYQCNIAIQFTHTHIYINIYAQYVLHIYTHKHTHIHAQCALHIHTHTHIYTHIYTPNDSHNTHTHIHTFMLNVHYTHTHIYTQIYTQNDTHITLILDLV